MNRKQFLKNSAKGVALTALLPSFVFCTTNGRQKTIPGNYRVSANFEPDVDIELTALPAELQLFPGNQTKIYSYQSKLLKGEQHSLEVLEGFLTGFLGNQIMVNGSLERTMEVSESTYQFRVLNGSNARIYKLAWDDGSDLTVIGTDGGLLEKPIKKPYLMLAPGQRAEIWKDFSDTGNEVQLQSLAFNDGTSMRMGGGMMGGGMMGGGMQAGGVENGIAFNLVRFETTKSGDISKTLPASFSPIKKIAPTEAVNSNSPRQFYFYNQRMQWVINGETFGMTEVADWEKVKLNTTEIWEFINGEDGRGMGMMQDMMRMPHPVHIHALQFQIAERDVSGMDRAVWETVKDGFVDEGWQDTFLLMPGMKVKIMMKFEDFKGIFVYHCHNLEHEDMGMMRNYEVI